MAVGGHEPSEQKTLRFTNLKRRGHKVSHTLRVNVSHNRLRMAGGNTNRIVKLALLSAMSDSDLRKYRQQVESDVSRTATGTKLGRRRP